MRCNYRNVPIEAAKKRLKDRARQLYFTSSILYGDLLATSVITTSYSLLQKPLVQHPSLVYVKLPDKLRNGVTWRFSDRTRIGNLQSLVMCRPQPYHIYLKFRCGIAIKTSNFCYLHAMRQTNRKELRSTTAIKSRVDSRHDADVKSSQCIIPLSYIVV